MTEPVPVYEKTPYGGGITPVGTTKAFIQLQADPDKITIQSYEPFKKVGDQYISEGTNNAYPVSYLTEVTEKPVLTHGTVYTPQPYGGRDIIVGTAFGLSSSVFLLARDKITLAKGVEAFGVNVKPLWGPHANVMVCMDDWGRIRNPFNKYPVSMLSKIDSGAVIMEKYVSCIAQIYVSHHQESFAGDGIRITTHPDYGHDSNIVFDKEVPNYPKAYHAFGEVFFPYIFCAPTVDCQAGQVVDIPIEVKRMDGSIYNGECDVYSKTDTGFLVTRKVTAIDGIATVRYMAMGLDPGYTAEIKLGFKWFENIMSVKINVV